MSEKEKKKVPSMIEVCSACSADKFVGDKCIAYAPAYQERLFKAGWCRLGNSGNKSPSDIIDTRKKRVTIQKKKK